MGNPNYGINMELRDYFWDNANNCILQINLVLNGVPNQQNHLINLIISLL